MGKNPSLFFVRSCGVHDVQHLLEDGACFDFGIANDFTWLKWCRKATMMIMNLVAIYRSLAFITHSSWGYHYHLVLWWLCGDLGCVVGAQGIMNDCQLSWFMMSSPLTALLSLRATSGGIFLHTEIHWDVWWRQKMTAARWARPLQTNRCISPIYQANKSARMKTRKSCWWISAHS